MSDRKRIIFHLDMDHFYTAVEEREHPEIKGKPVIVGSDPKKAKAEASYPPATMKPERLVCVRVCRFLRLGGFVQRGLFAAEFSTLH